MQKVILTIDPGLTGTGVVAWDAKDWYRKNSHWDFKAILLKPKNTQWQIAAYEITNAFQTWLNQMDVITMYIEFPQAFQSALGQAAINRGDIFKLTFLIGYLRGICPYSLFEPVNPIRWKGQLSKSETERRLKLIVPQKFWVKSTHLWDAVGISLYLQGKF